MTVYLAVGHGERPGRPHDPGAVKGDVTEQTLGDPIVREAARLLRSWGETVIDEAYSDDPAYVGTVAAANAAKVDLVVEVHHDWSGGVDAAHGFWWPQSTAGQRAVRAILSAVGSAGFRVSDAHTKARSDLYLLRNTSMPAALIECGRVGGTQTDTDAERKAMGAAIARGVAAYMGIVPGPSRPVPPGVVDPADTRFPDGWAYGIEHRIVRRGTKPDDTVTKEELMEFARRGDWSG